MHRKIEFVFRTNFQSSVINFQRHKIPDEVDIIELQGSIVVPLDRRTKGIVRQDADNANESRKKDEKASFGASQDP